VRGITGRFLVYGGALPYIERIAADQPDFVGYNPAISGMILNYNRANFVWAAGGGTLAVNAEGARFVPSVRSVQVALAQREAPLFVYEGRAPVEAWSVAAPALRKDGSRWLPVRAPVVYAGDVFGALCAAQGIKLPPAREIATLPAGAHVLAEDRSEGLEALIKGMLKFSTNLTAEALGLAASGAVDIAESGAAMTAWARARFGISAQFGDHSGLGPMSSSTPADMVRVMLGAKGSALIGLMREKGVDGEGREAQGAALRVFAKSGTLNFASNLAGYITAPSGRALAFAIFAADSPRRAALPLDQREDPEGGAAWNKRARAMQRQMIAKWGKAYL
jgi:D-alanyl-D-alanine carboxypeptidase/D-alanyl-D-alanine-endopeptidase (penicillin-binding protein 4)